MSGAEKHTELLQGGRFYFPFYAKTPLPLPKMPPINITATIDVLRALFKNPAQLCPHSTIASFDQLPIPLSRAFSLEQKGPDIRAVILDKDNCFAAPHALDVWPAYLVCSPHALTPIAAFRIEG